MNEGFVSISLSATNSTILQNKRVLFIIHFVNGYEIIIIVKFFYGWEVSVLLAVLDWLANIRVSPAKNSGILVLEHISEDTFG